MEKIRIREGKNPDSQRCFFTYHPGSRGEVAPEAASSVVPAAPPPRVRVRVASHLPPAAAITPQLWPVVLLIPEERSGFFHGCPVQLGGDTF
jgi:hypothetical protein